MSAELPIQMFDLPKGHRRETLNRVAWRAGTRATTTIRISRELLDQIDAFAEVSFRSRNAEIDFRLRESFEGQSIDEHGCIVVHAASRLK